MAGANKSSIHTLAAFAVFAVATLAGGCASNTATPTSDGPKSFAFWPEAPDEPHIQFVRSFNSSADVTPGRSNFDQILYGSDQRSVAINKPYGVRMWNGRIYVCEIRGDKGMLVLDLRKQQARLMGATGTVAITKAVDLAVSPDGVKYVLDAVLTSVLVYDPEEHYVTTFPLPKETQPGGIAVNNNRLYITDLKNGKVLLLDRGTGKILATFGERGGEDGQFIGPLAVATDKQGNVYVSDTIRARISKFSSDGRFIMAFGETGDRPGNFTRPKHLGVGSDGMIHVVDAAFNNVQVFDELGQVLGYYGAEGSHMGAMDLPAGLDVHEGDMDLFEKLIHPAFQADRLILVTNQFGRAKISLYAVGHLKEGKSVADIAPARAKNNSGLTTQPVTQPAFAPEPAKPAAPSTRSAAAPTTRR